ncbi:TonB-dependent receptor [Piscinibacter sakaiensis]|uniref:TonB-dependent receptor n=1 Tax=Piscinibacter sakaiensis TaxID=1547922 RepID=UPI0018D1C438|nr:TonB-dependent receptor [Piscinibacter sakaiensis]
MPRSALPPLAWRGRLRRPTGLAAAALGLCAAAMAEDGTTTTTLDTVVVKGQGLSEGRHQPFSVTRFDAALLRERQVSQAQQLFREVPGMTVRGLGYDGVADSMTLRGFSGGGHGGDIGFVIDGIPLNEASSHADGYADLNVIVPLELAGMDVFKGPVSALYGNFNRAGVVALRSRQGGDYRELDARVGSYGVVDVQGAYGGRAGGLTLNGAAQAYRSGGYRPDTGSERATLSGRAALDLGPDTRLAVAARAHRAESTTASVVTQAQFDRRDGFFDKDPRVQNDGADKDFATLRTDLAHQLAPGLRLLAFAYGTDQNFTRYFTRPTNASTWQQRAEDYRRRVRGFGLNLNGEQAVGGRRLRWVAGAESYEERTRFRYADGLIGRAVGPNTLTAGVAGGTGTLDRLLRTDTDALFGQAEWALAETFRPTLALRHDRIAGGCERLGPETRTGASAQCAAMQAFAVTTPKLGLRSTWVPGVLEARGSVAEGFALPGDAAKFTAGLAVEPTVFRQHEIGLRLTPAPGLLADVAVFRIDSRDEVALTDAATLTYANVGRTRREGVEAELRWSPADAFELRAVLAHNRSKVIESLATTPWLVGSELTGVARRMATLTATVRPAEAWSLSATARSVGRMAITQPSATAAPVYDGGYDTVDLMLAWEPAAAGGRRLRGTLQVANLTDRRYATSSGVTAGLRTYNPAPPRTVMVGASLDF